MSFRRSMSLRHRLPLLILVLLTASGAAFAWASYREMESVLRAQGNVRIVTAGTYLAELLSQQTSARMGESRRLAADPTVRRFVHDGDGADAAVAILQEYLQRNPQAAISVFDSGGRLLGRMNRTSTGMNALDGDPAAPPPPGEDGEVGAMRLKDGRIQYTTAFRVPPLSAEAGAASGWLSIDRTLGSSPLATLLERLIGRGAKVKIGNAAGDVWTDLSSPVSPPPGPVPAAHAVRYAADRGVMRLGNAVPIPRTPWLIWVELDEAELLEPARTLLGRVLPLTLLLVAIGAVGVRAATARITTPLEHLASAADALAAGDYSRRVDVRRGDEIGRLGATFNLMAERVAVSREALEARVRTRTMELEQAREELDQFFSLSLDLLCIAGTDGRFRRVNPAWEQTLGWTSADLTVGPFIDLVHPDDVAATERETGSLSTGMTTVNFENRFRCSDGSYRWLSWKAVASVDRGLIYGAARDITDQKRAALELQQQAAALADANRELEAFSYSVSHDLRAPLRSIDGFSQALVEDYADRLDDTARDNLARIRGAAQRMGALIDDLLSLARVTRLELTPMEVDLSAIAVEIAGRLEEQAPHRRVEWHIAPGLKALGDPRLLRIALENLLGNAWKFTARQHTATIVFTREPEREDEAAYIVRDNGAGFDMAYASKLFAAFQRLHVAADFPGTGIGLATVQRIVRRHRGRIWAQARPGRGATFSFTLGSEPVV